MIKVRECVEDVRLLVSRYQSAKLMKRIPVYFVKIRVCYAVYSKYTRGTLSICCQGGIWMYSHPRVILFKG